MAAAGAPILSIDPFSEDFLADPYAHHEALRQAGPVVWLEQYEVFAMARFDEVQAALRDHQTFCSGRGVGLADFSKEEPFRPPSLLLEADPPLHDRTRSLMNKIVSLKVLKELRPGWETKARELVAGLVKKGGFDAVPELAEAFPLIVFPDTIGLSEEGREHLIEYATIVFNAFGPRNRLFEESHIGKEASIAWVAEACKRENLRPGGWGRAVYEAAEHGGFSEDEAARLVRSFLTAGVDTTVNGIAHRVYALASSPEEFARLQFDPKLATRAFEESLRWDSTVQTFFRTTTREVEIGDRLIPKGAKVLLFLAAANRDPRKWDDPDTYSILRPAGGSCRLRLRHPPVPRPDGGPSRRRAGRDGTCQAGPQDPSGGQARAPAQQHAARGRKPSGPDRGSIVMTEQPILYFAPQTCARVTLTALEEIGDPFKTRLIAFLAGEHRRPDFLAINPSGKVPALQTVDGVIVQNGAILSYLAEVHPEAGLLPRRRDAAGRAAVLAELFRCSSDLHPLVTRFVIPQLMTAEEAGAPHIRARAREGLEFQLAPLAERLQRQDWCLEEGWSVVDAYLAWIWFRITGAGFDADAFPALGAHFARASARPSARAALEHEERAQEELKRRGLFFRPPAFDND